MIKGLALALGLLALSTSAWAALWQDIVERDVPSSGVAREIVPQRYRSLRLDRSELATLLKQAPLEGKTALAKSALLLPLPLPDGSTQVFRVVESPIMESELAARYPEIRTYLGQGVDDPSATLRFDLTSKGFRAQVLSAAGTVYIDPLQPKDTEHYISYAKADYARPADKQWSCTVEGESAQHGIEDLLAKRPDLKISSGANLRTYRLAMAATGEYTAFHGGTVEAALGAIVTTMNRVNGIYERDVAVRMVLINNTDQVIYTNGSTDPYSNGSGSAMLGENVSNLSTVIGNGNFDIGHVVSTGGGGVASLGSVCGSGKARGVTGQGAPRGDAFDVDFVAHEMGHQFAGNHTFNGSGGSCSGGNRNGSTAYETGSGVTIQAYAGICSGDNLQPNSEDYFHRLSLNEILNFTTSGGGSSCGTLTATGNQVPTVSTTPSYTIPASTPFELVASGSDADGDTLTYVWEQFNLGSANAVGSLIDNGGPLFRSFAPGLSPNRIVPSLRYVLNNQNTPPSTAPLPGTTSPSYFTGEALSTTDRTLNFRVTVRDNRAGGGGTNEASSALSVISSAGPFRITAPNTAISWAAGTAQTVTWDVANTSGGSINAANVRIRLSLDGGYTWPTELVASTANDGSESVTLPANTPASAQARLRVEAVGNIFFDVSDSNFTVTNANAAPTLSVTGSVSTRQGSPTASANVATVSDGEDAVGTLSVAVSEAPSELAVSAINNNGTVELSATAGCDLVAPSSGSRNYPVKLTVSDSGGASRSEFVNVAVSANQKPTLGAYADLNVGRSSTTPHSPAQAASDVNLQSVTVSPTTLPGGGSVSVDAAGQLTVATTGSTTFGSTEVTVSATDSCGATQLQRFNLAVLSNEPALEIASSAISSGNGLLEPNECNQFTVSLRNSGIQTATGVSASLSSLTPGITITQASSAFADIAAGATEAAQTSFQISSSAGLVCLSDVDLTLNVTYSGGGSPFSDTVTLPVGRAPGDNYEFVASSGASIPGGGVLVPDSADDDVLVDLTVPSGFDFSVYGTSVSGGSTLRASTNGALQLVSSAGSAAYANGALPSAGTGNSLGSFPSSLPVLLPYWDDLRLDSPGGGIYTALNGSEPNRTWTVEWRGMRWASSVGPITTQFAVVFHEDSNAFEYIYTLVDNGGAGATVGVQAATTGSLFTQYSLNSSSLSAGQQLAASIPAGECNAGGGMCAGGPAISLIQSGGSTAVSEAGATDSYQLVLQTEPSSTVTIDVSPNSQLEVDQSQLQFNTGNWDTPQSIVVSAVDDAVEEGNHSGLITHSASGGGYDGVTAPSLVVAIADNDLSVDLGVTNSLQGSAPIAGETASYEVVVSNLSSDVDVASAQFNFTATPMLTGVTWTCLPGSGATCPASGSGLPSHSISLDRSAGLIYTINGQVAGGAAPGSIQSTTATVGVSAPYVDSNSGNNSAVSNSVVGPLQIFLNGFEGD
ncbi:reprolysin-like metallopeptidase [Pseudomarimonas arenosa]|uniref:reprolysin-like metallopeptidase n=1 Tax=Pseudomarimonas arenosa TaxID=2774145 RepID=UPI001CDCC236|nr:zinc-dependent metalloprotease family protein [Pseudomarimonas arenosa]